VVAKPITDDRRAPVAAVTRADGWLHARPTFAAAALVVVLVSGVVAALSALVSRMVWRPGPLALPWGLLLAVAASVAVVLLGRVLTRGLGFVAAGSWIVTTGLVLGGRPEGDYVFAQDGLGFGYLVLSVVLVISAAAAGGPPR
jgi:hypothetical protein